MVAAQSASANRGEQSAAVRWQLPALGMVRPHGVRGSPRRAVTDFAFSGLPGRVSLDVRRLRRGSRARPDVRAALGDDRAGRASRCVWRTPGSSPLRYTNTADFAYDEMQAIEGADDAGAGRPDSRCGSTRRSASRNASRGAAAQLGVHARSACGRGAGGHGAVAGIGPDAINRALANAETRVRRHGASGPQWFHSATSCLARLTRATRPCRCRSRAGGARPRSARLRARRGFDHRRARPRQGHFEAAKWRRSSREPSGAASRSAGARPSSTEGRRYSALMKPDGSAARRRSRRPPTAHTSSPFDLLKQAERRPETGEQHARDDQPLAAARPHDARRAVLDRGPERMRLHGRGACRARCRARSWRYARMDHFGDALALAGPWMPRRNPPDARSSSTPPR